MVWRGRAGWAHEFNPQQTIAATFAALPGSSFDVTGAGLPADALLLSAAADLSHRNGWTVGTRIDGKLAGGAQSIAARATFRYRW